MTYKMYMYIGFRIGSNNWKDVIKIEQIFNESYLYVISYM